MECQLLPREHRHPLQPTRRFSLLLLPPLCLCLHLLSSFFSSVCLSMPVYMSVSVALCLGVILCRWHGWWHGVEWVWHGWWHGCGMGWCGWWQWLSMTSCIQIDFPLFPNEPFVKRSTSIDRAHTNHASSRLMERQCIRSGSISFSLSLCQSVCLCLSVCLPVTHWASQSNWVEFALYTCTWTLPAARNFKYRRK